MAILNYSTKIPAEKTIGEISGILARAGARKIVHDYDERGRPIGITFMIPINDQLAGFSLPCNAVGVLLAMKRDKVAKQWINEEQAIRTGWRIIKDWTASQMALVDAQLLTLAQVFLSQAITADGRTIYERITENPGQYLLTQ